MIHVPALLLLGLAMSGAVICFFGGALTTAFVFWINNRKPAK